MNQQPKTSSTPQQFINTITPQEDQFVNQFFSPKNLSFYINRSEEDQKDFFQALNQKIFEISGSNLPLEQKQTAIQNLTCFIPFALGREKEINIPVYHNGDWQSVAFHIERIALTPSFLPASDQYYALGLRPINRDNIASKLIMMGTAPPSITGSLTTVFADLFPFASIGWPITRKSQKLINWSKEQNAIEGTGLSLGGAVMLAHAKHIQNLKRVDIFNPALPISAPDLGDTITHVHVNHNDPVHKTGGRVPLNATVHLYQAQSPTKSLLLNWFFPHIQCYAAASNTKEVQMSGQTYNTQLAKLSAYFLYFIMRPIAFVVFLPFYLIALTVKLIGYIITMPLRLTGVLPCHPSKDIPPTPPPTFNRQSKKPHQPTHRPQQQV